MRASLRGGVLTLAEVHRFPKVPVRDNGSQRWDLYRLWREMRAALRQCNVARLESIGVDAWGCDYGLLREDGTLVELSRWVSPRVRDGTRGSGEQAPDR